MTEISKTRKAVTTFFTTELALGKAAPKMRGKPEALKMSKTEFADLPQDRRRKLLKNAVSSANPKMNRFNKKIARDSVVAFFDMTQMTQRMFRNTGTKVRVRQTPSGMIWSVDEDCLRGNFPNRWVDNVRTELDFLKLETPEIPLYVTEDHRIVSRYVDHNGATLIPVDGPDAIYDCGHYCVADFALLDMVAYLNLRMASGEMEVWVARTAFQHLCHAQGYPDLAEAHLAYFTGRCMGIGTPRELRQKHPLATVRDLNNKKFRGVASNVLKRLIPGPVVGADGFQY